MKVQDGKCYEECERERAREMRLPSVVSRGEMVVAGAAITQLVQREPDDYNNIPIANFGHLSIHGKDYYWDAD